MIFSVFILDICTMFRITGNTLALDNTLLEVTGSPQEYIGENGFVCTRLMENLYEAGYGEVLIEKRSLESSKKYLMKTLKKFVKQYITGDYNREYIAEQLRIIQAKLAKFLKYGYYRQDTDNDADKGWFYRFNNIEIKAFRGYGTLLGIQMRCKEHEKQLKTIEISEEEDEEDVGDEIVLDNWINDWNSTYLSAVGNF